MSQQIDLFDFEKVAKEVRLYLERNRLTFRKFGELSKIDAGVVSKIAHCKYRGYKPICDVLEYIGKNIDDYKANNFVVKPRLYLSDIADLDKATIEDIDDLISKLKDIRETKIKEQQNLVLEQIEDLKLELTRLQNL